METALTKEQTKEYFDSPEELKKKIQQFAMMILSSEKFVTFTGAGISTGAGIPDYRSAEDSIMGLGAGKWARQSDLEAAKKAGKTAVPTKNKSAKSVIGCVPTKCHMSLVKLMETGFLKHVISQNTDGMHRRSGIPAVNLSEVHGNSNLKVCVKCKQEYMRDYGVQTPLVCAKPACKGELKRTIINFGEHLDPKILERGFFNGETADLMLGMGSSLCVNPAASMAKATAENGGKLVIINLQTTPLDPYAAFLIHAKIDDVFEMLMKELNILIPQFKLKRWVKASIEESKTGKETLKVEGIDHSGCPYELFKSTAINKKASKSYTLTEQELAEIETKFEVQLSPFGHYGERDITLQLDRNMIKGYNNEIRVEMVFNPATRQWESATAYDKFQAEALGSVIHNKVAPKHIQQLNKKFNGMSMKA